LKFSAVFHTNKFKLHCEKKLHVMDASNRSLESNFCTYATADIFPWVLHTKNCNHTHAAKSTCIGYDIIIYPRINHFVVINGFIKSPGVEPAKSRTPEVRSQGLVYYDSSSCNSQNQKLAHKTEKHNSSAANTHPQRCATITCDNVFLCELVGGGWLGGRPAITHRVKGGVIIIIASAAG
jgi:hypothetical protein